MELNEDEINILKEKDFILISDKKIEYKVKLFITNNDLLCINVFTNKIISSKKYSLSLTMNDLIKNRFFKIFINLDEIFRELENKIEKSIIIEDTNLIYLDIPIGLNIINDIILEIKEIKKSKEEIIQELEVEINNKNILINEKDIKIKELENKNKEFEIKLNEIQNELNEKIIEKKEELEINEILINSYENVIEIELETNENNQEIKIINKNNKTEDTILFINKNKTNFNNFIKFEKKGEYKIIILNNNKLENLKELFCDCKKIKKIKFYKIILKM